MRTLRGIGYWRNESRPEFPDPHDFVDSAMDEMFRYEIGAYLRRGLHARAFMGYSTCRICGKADNGNEEYTDGTYLWPSGLAHYVEEHGVRLPDEFIRHSREVVDSNEQATGDWSWWLRQRPHP